MNVQQHQSSGDAWLESEVFGERRCTLRSTARRHESRRGFRTGHLPGTTTQIFDITTK